MAPYPLLAVLLTFQAAQPTAASFRPEGMASEAMRSDARLADVCFVDPGHGWAVGDRGAIWHTDDGGKQWQPQHAPVACRLESVCFIDQQIGWAAGGFSHPYTHGGTGVLLATRDGGRTWHHSPRLLLPVLKKLRFFDQTHGWAIGCPSAMFPSGVFVTENGGKSWMPLSSGNLGSWLAGDLLDSHTGALAGRNGTVVMVRRGGLQPARMGSFGLRNLTEMKLVAPMQGWLVGDGGLVMVTGDLGASWQTPPADLPDGMAAEFDFAALAVRGPKCWIAGSPGTRVFYSPDAGRTWQAGATATPLPIHALAFADDEHGWAVGDLGTILATTDGGRSWRRQRAGGTRAALLGLFRQGTDLPLELFVRLCGNEGYLGVVEVLNRRDVEVPSGAEVPAADRVHEAAVGVGASGARTAWRFPLRQAGLRFGQQRIIDGWDRANDFRGLQQFEAHCVRQIRLWRPEVVVTHGDDPRGDDPLGRLINQAVLKAVQKAADPTCLPRQITHAGLEPWQARKVYASLPSGRGGTIDLTTAQLATRLGRSLADVAATPRGLLENRFTVAPQMLGFRLLMDHLPQESGRGDFFSGIVLYPGGDARRELTQPPAESLELLRRSAQRRRNMQAIIEQAEESPQPDARLLAEADELTRGLDGDGAGQILYQLAERYYRTGRWAMAAEAFELLTDRYPQHPLSEPALRWLVQYYASGEAAWRLQAGQRFAVQQASALSIDLSRQENRPQRAAELGRQIERTRPALFADGALRFPLAVAHRKQGFPRQAERFFLGRARGADHDAWWACAQGERWLAEPEGPPPKAVLHCAAAPAKPRLDGRLDDAVWQRARPARLQSAQHDDADWPAAVMLAYDRQFLYLAVSCRRARGAKYEAAGGPRPRDPDLSTYDRVDVLLDLDRDFATYYRLSIDHRGHTGEGCWGDRTWNPTWFVAAATADGVWTGEAAVPLEQLTGRYPASGHVWALGLQRTVPGVGFQAWTTPAATVVMPEGFGYLIFD